MEKNDFNYIRLLFPKFRSPEKSRFSTLFNEISHSREDFYVRNPINLDSDKEDEDFYKYIIDPKKVINGLEKRTSIIIKGIPCYFGCLSFYQLLTQFSKDIDFFYVPGYALGKWEYIYAFVNVCHCKGILNIYEGLTTIRDKYKRYGGFDFSKIEIYYCKSKNINGLMKKSQNDKNLNNFLIINRS